MIQIPWLALWVHPLYPHPDRIGKAEGDAGTASPGYDYSGYHAAQPGRD